MTQAPNLVLRIVIPSVFDHLFQMPQTFLLTARRVQMVPEKEEQDAGNDTDRDNNNQELHVTSAKKTTDLKYEAVSTAERGLQCYRNKGAPMRDVIDAASSSSIGIRHAAL